MLIELLPVRASHCLQRKQWLLLPLVVRQPSDLLHCEQQRSTRGAEALRRAFATDDHGIASRGIETSLQVFTLRAQPREPRAVHEAGHSGVPGAATWGSG